MASSRPWSMSRSLRDDEEMAKRDDDLLRAKVSNKSSARWKATATHTPRRSVILRCLAYAAACFTLVYLLRHFTEETPSRNPSSHKPIANTPPIKHDFGSSVKDKPHHEELPKSKPPLSKAQTSTKATVEYNGPVKFETLYKSLRAIGPTMGAYGRNRNVLFIASSLQSVSNLLPMACQMAAEKENYVHVAIMSRSEIPIDELLKVNGIDKSCSIIVHDARPDHSSTSSETRMVIAIMRALYHITAYMHPQAIIVDGTNTEERLFLPAIKDQLKDSKSALIELPEQAHSRFSWISKLDAAALSEWNEVRFDIIIQAPFSGSGNLHRLLNSLTRADLIGHLTPHLTIELPPIIEPSLETMLKDFSWPPRSSSVSNQPQLLSLRHRIVQKKLTVDESSIRFLESFWPNKPSHTHVLILSANTEVSPQFFHYVKYEILFRKYSKPGIIQDTDERIFGVSFSYPKVYSHNDKPFKSPSSRDKDSSRQHPDSPFLWQTPSSDALLIWGEKWKELHGFVSQVHEKKGLMAQPSQILAQKHLTTKYPAWMEYIVLLSRIRQYTTVYPSKAAAASILSVHTDLGITPEEFQDQGSKQKRPLDAFTDPSNEGFTSQADLLRALPDRGTLGNIMSVPILSWDGQETDVETLTREASELTKSFRREIGQCAETARVLEPDKMAQDLFCTK